MKNKKYTPPLQSKFKKGDKVQPVRKGACIAPAIIKLVDKDYKTETVQYLIEDGLWFDEHELVPYVPSPKFEQGTSVISFKGEVKTVKRSVYNNRLEQFECLLDDNKWVLESALKEKQFDPYEEMYDQWDELIKGTYPLSGQNTIFSCYKEGAEGESHIPEINLQSKKEFAKGTFGVKINSRELPYLKVTNPTIEDIAKIFNTYNNGHNIFFEDVTFDKNNMTMKISAGS